MKSASTSTEPQPQQRHESPLRQFNVKGRRGGNNQYLMEKV